ncbi:sigma-70 domain-containing protein [Anaerolentibacter hominis]|uniref:sigma-70 domain-containing protein n=1 Tax=Anaerolentibacter hominis TaxID=3079009 RepID=UPI0031B816C3
MDKESFQNRLRDMVEQAQIKGNVLTQEEVRRFFGELKEEQMDLVYAFLAENQIRVKGYLPPAVVNEETEEETEEDEFELLAKDSAFLAMYKDDLDQIASLTQEEEDYLFERFLNGDQAARARLIEGNLRMVIDAAMTYKDQGINLEDLIQEGNIGLVMGLEAAREEASSSWRNEVERAVLDTLEQAVYEHNNQTALGQKSTVQSDLVQEAVKKFEEENGKKPDIHELAQFLDMDQDELRAVLNLSVDAIKLEEHHHH